MGQPSNFHDIPNPHSAIANRNRMEPSVDNASKIAKLWRPVRAGLQEIALSTIARSALRLIDRTNGMSYSADELMAKMGPEVVLFSTLGTNQLTIDDRSMLNKTYVNDTGQSVGIVLSVFSYPEKFDFITFVSVTHPIGVYVSPSDIQYEVAPASSATMYSEGSGAFVPPSLSVNSLYASSPIVASSFHEATGDVSITSQGIQLNATEVPPHPSWVMNLGQISSFLKHQEVYHAITLADSTSVINTTSFNAISPLTLIVPAGTYEVDAMICATSSVSNNGGWKFAYTTSTAVTGRVRYEILPLVGSPTFLAALPNPSGIVFTGAGVHYIGSVRGVVSVTSTTAFNILHALQSTDASLPQRIVTANSYHRLTRIS